MRGRARGGSVQSEVVELRRKLDGLIMTFSKMIGKNDPYTEFHCQGVMMVTGMLCEEIGYVFSYDLKIAALLHDVGKVFISARILNKPGPLNVRERRVIELHSRWSQEVLQDIPGFEQIAAWTGQHHETLDGQGYPHRLKGDELSFEAQLIGVADFIDATCTNRSYRPRHSYDEVSRLLKDMGYRDKFAKALVEAGLHILQSSEFQRIYHLKGKQYVPAEDFDTRVFHHYTEGFEDFFEELEEFNAFLVKSPCSLPLVRAGRTVKVMKEIASRMISLAETITDIAHKQEKKIA